MINLTKKEMKTIFEILEKFVPDFEVWAFGSRIEGTKKKFSDLDLVIIGEKEIDIYTLGRLKEAFEDSDLPYSVDVIDWNRIPPEFRNIILKNYVVIKGKQIFHSGS
ncbi:MAG: nucleotidyltransferase family protein [Brevinematia bacterium]